MKPGERFQLSSKHLTCLNRKVRHPIRLRAGCSKRDRKQKLWYRHLNHTFWQIHTTFTVTQHVFLAIIAARCPYSFRPFVTSNLAASCSHDNAMVRLFNGLHIHSVPKWCHCPPSSHEVIIHSAYFVGIVYAIIDRTIVFTNFVQPRYSLIVLVQGNTVATRIRSPSTTPWWTRSCQTHVHTLHTCVVVNLSFLYRHMNALSLLLL